MRMSDWIRPIGQGWVVRDAVPGPDVDEFAEPDRVVAALAAPGAADSLLAVQHPARTPAALARGLDLAAAVPVARAVLERLRKRFYRPVREIVAPYRIEGPDGVALGLLCLVDPAAVTDDGAARVRHTEDVYPDVVAERAAVLAGLGCATSAALLVPAAGGDLLTEQVYRACADLGLPDLSTSDAAGRRHELWVVPAGPLQDRLLAAVAGADLLVADGNHRVAAASGGRARRAARAGHRGPAAADRRDPPGPHRHRLRPGRAGVPLVRGRPGRPVRRARRAGHRRGRGAGRPGGAADPAAGARRGRSR